MLATVPERLSSAPPPQPRRSERAGAPVLVVEDEPVTREHLTQLLANAGYEVVAVADGQAALDVLHARTMDVVLLDLHLPKVSGMSVLSALPSLHTDAKFVVLTGHGSVETAVEAMKLGAYDYVRKPLDEAELLHIVDRGLSELKVRRELKRLKSSTPRRHVHSMVGKTPAMQRVFDLIDRVAPTKANVLVTGETGTGKELVARAVHELSPRADKPFVAVNCSAIPAALLEAELFGHMRGSFTGAVQSRKGLIEEAAGGTLFLDEVSTLSQDVQVKLLRVLEDRRVQRVGSNTPVSVDFRLVAATNTDLGPLVAAGDFREDLFFRLDVFAIPVPALRDRLHDIPLLTTHFTARFAGEHGVEPPRVSANTLSRMMAYDWPGNVRELENFIERSVIMYPGSDGFPFDLPRARPGNDAAAALGDAVEHTWTLERLEREYLLSMLERNRWQQAAVADMLGINRRTIHRKLKRYREEGYLLDATTA
jgi:DNA-binding NtrC family response regulator